MTDLKQHWLSLTVAVAALVVAMGAPSAAIETGHRVVVKAVGQQITGKQIKNGSIQAKDLSAAARASLSGQQGPAGPPGPATGAAGGDLTGSYPNPQLAPDSVGIPEVATIPAVKVVGATGPIVTGTTSTVLNWGGTFTYRTVASMYDVTEGTKFVAPVDGVYLAAATVGFEPNTVGIRSVNIAINGANTNPACFDRDGAAPELASFVNASCAINLDAGDFITVRVVQTSGASLNLSGFETASLTWLGSLT